MHRDDLNMIWICSECRTSFIFHSDVDDHREKTGHLKIHKYDLLSGKLLDGIGI